MTRDIDSILDELEYALAEADAYNVKGVFENEQELRRLAERTDLDPADLLKRASVLTHMPISPVSAVSPSDWAFATAGTKAPRAGETAGCVL